MTESDFSQLFKLLNSDFYRGRSHLNRLSPAFVGQTAQNLLADLVRLNSWTARIWRGGEEDALEASVSFSQTESSCQERGLRTPRF